MDPEALRPEDRLEDIGISGIARWWLISLLEATCQVQFPPDLITAIETVDDLGYFVSVKLEQRSG